MKRRFVLGSFLVCVVAQPLGAVAQQVASPDLRLNNFPAHATTLSPEHLVPLRAGARQLAALVALGKPVYVMTVGYADFDAKGRAFENQVSQSRAESGLKAFRIEFDKAATEANLAPELRAKVDFWEAIPQGSLDPIVKNPSNEAQRRLNRRVEFYWSTEEVASAAIRRSFTGK
jgi:hypothetical protein